MVSPPTSTQTQTLTSRLWMTRGLSVFLLAALAGAGVVVWSAMMTWRISHLPDIGLRVTNDNKVLTARAEWAPVKAGDTIELVGSETPTNGADTLEMLLTQPLGAQLELTATRDGARHVGRLIAKPVEWFNAIALWGRLFTIFAYIALGIAVFVLRPGFRTSWMLFVFSLAFGTMLSSFIVFFENPLMHFRMVAVARPLCLALATLLAFEFPKPMKFGQVPRWAVYVGLLIPPLAFVLSLTVFEVAEYVVFRTGVAIWQMITLIFAVGFTLWQYRSAKRGTSEKTFAQSRAILIAQWTGLIIPALLDLLRSQTWLAKENLWSHCYNSAPFILFVVITTYAAIAHNALEVDRFTASAFGYTVTLGVLTLFFVGVFMLFPLLVGSTFSSDNPVVMVTLAGVGFLGFRPLHSALKKRIDVAFAREAPDATRMARALADLTEAVHHRTLAETRTLALQSMGILQTTRAEVWDIGPDGLAFVCTMSSVEAHPTEPAVFYVGDPLARAVEMGAGGLADLAPRVFPELASNQLASRHLVMTAPMLISGSLKGFIAVGRRTSGVPFRVEDMGFLNAIASQLGLAMERAGAESNRMGRYRLGRRLGLGGMAEVFEAWQRAPGGIERRVALKRPLPDMEDDPKFITMFLDEARISSQLQHPNIAQIHEVDVVAGKYFIAMEFIDGMPLRQLLMACMQKYQTIPFKIVMSISNGLLSALDYAHSLKDDHGVQMNIVHRDVSPSNVMITRRGDVKLVDFGIARAATKVHRTKAGVVQGTVPYMSPEHASGQPVDHRSDVYAAGALIYELMTMTRAFPIGPTSTERPQRASDLVEGVPPAVDAVLQRAFASNVEERYPTAGAFRDALIEAAAGQLATPAEVATWVASVEVVIAEVVEKRAEDAATRPISISAK